MEIVTKYFGFNKILSIFPELYNYKEYSPLILRSSVGIIFVGDGWRDINKRGGLKIFNIIIGSLKIISGLALLFGTYTQLWALVAGGISVFNIFFCFKEGNYQKVKYYLLVLIILISILLSGPGLYSIDLPL